MLIQKIRFMLCFGLALFLMAISPIQAKKIADLPDIMKPDRMIIHQNRVYIADGTSIKIIDTVKGHQTAVFGKKGEGPGEFQHSPRLFAVGNRLLVNATGKLISFTLDGNFLKEQKVKGHNSRYLPLGDKFIGRQAKAVKNGSNFEQVVSLYDREFNPIKTLYRAAMPGMMRLSSNQTQKPKYRIINDLINYYVMANRFIIADSSKGFFLKILDKNGNLIKEARPKYEKKRVTDAIKKEALDKLSHEAWYKQLKNRFEFVFPEFFPAFQGIRVSGQHLLVQTYESNNDNLSYVVLDKTGKQIKALQLPKPTPDSDLYCIDNETYYYLTENEDAESWELHAIKLDLN